MFRILLEVNDLQHLRRLKPGLVEEILRRFSTLTSAGEYAHQGNILFSDTEDDDAESTITGLYGFYEFLLEHRKKLHGFLLAFDYAPRSGRFSLDPRGEWTGRIPEIDVFLVSFDGFQVVEAVVESSPMGRFYRVEALRMDETREYRPLHSLAAAENVDIIDGHFGLWKEGQDEGRPVFLHMLSPAEQLRLAQRAAVLCGSEESFLLIDLNYPWRSGLAAYLGCFGLNPVSSLAKGINPDALAGWQSTGEGLLRGMTVFSWKDAAAWFGETIKAYVEVNRREGNTPCIVITGADKLNRFGRIITDGFLSSMHAKGELYTLLLADSVPRRRRGQFSFCEFRKAEVRDGAGEPEGLNLSSEQKTVYNLALRFSPFLSCSQLRMRLYETGLAKHMVDSFLVSLVDSGRILKGWRYYFCQNPDGSGVYPESVAAPFLSPDSDEIPSIYRMDYAAIAAAVRPELGSEHYRFLLNAVYERRDSVAAAGVAGLLKSLPRRFRDYYIIARGMASVFADQGTDTDLQISGGGDLTLSESSHLQVLMVENFLRMNLPDEALREAKSFLFDVQGEDQPCSVTEAQHALGMVMLRKGRIEEANDYFALAYESSKTCNASVDRIRACINRALGLFLFGNYSRADRHLSEALDLSPGLCHGPYLLFARFLKGRIAFMLGRYEEAENQLWQTLSLATLTGVPHAVFYAWIARARIYAGKYRDGIGMLERLNKTGEVLFFLAEGYYFREDLQSALTVIRRAQKRVKFETRDTSKYMSYRWDSGFRNVEDAAFRSPEGRGVLLNCVSAFRWLVEKQLGNPVENGSSLLEKITREEKLGDLDPYYYYYYLIHALLISEETHDENLERITYLSKGLKYLQRTSSVIDDVPSRLEFLSGNRWNRYLMDIARNEKLA